MSTTADLFARWKAAKGYTSERQALKALRLSPGAAVHWKAGRNADADVIEKMAKDLGENAYALVAQAMAEQAKGPAARTWTRIAKRLAVTTITLLPVVSGVVQADPGHSGDARAMYYAKL
jgi:Phage related protein.